MESILGIANFTIDFSAFDILKSLYILSVAFGGIKKLKAAVDVLSNSSLSFDTKHLNAVVASTALMAHIAKGFPGPSAYIFYQVQQYENPRGVSNIVPPNISFLGKSTMLTLVWNSRDRYTGGDYFQQANPAVILQQLATEEDRRKACTIRNLAGEVGSIINFMISESILDNGME